VFRNKKKGVEERERGTERQEVQMERGAEGKERR
jgi:hypothetical protein